MHKRTLIIERDDPAEPGLILRRYARVMTCWDPSLGGWAWGRLNAAGSLIGGMTGPFHAAQHAWEEAAETLEGVWEDESERV